MQTKPRKKYSEKNLDKNQKKCIEKKNIEKNLESPENIEINVLQNQEGKRKRKKKQLS